MELFAITFQQIAELFLLILLGYLCCKAGIVTEGAKKTLSAILLHVVIPAVILNAFLSEDVRNAAPALVTGLVLAVSAHVFMLLLAAVLLPKRRPHYRIERICAAYTNAGFMGLPLLSALFGETGAFYASIYLAVFHLFMWTQGVFSLKEKRDLRAALKQLCSPTLIAVAAAIILYFLRIRLPELLMEPIGYISDMNTPFAMLVTGVSLASYKLSELFGNRKIYYVAALRLLVFPILLWFFFRALWLSGEAVQCTALLAACPTAAVVPMVALSYEQDEKTASGAFALTTLLCLFTIPVVVLLF